MAQQNNNGPLATLALLISLALMGGGIWWLVNRLELFGTSEPNDGETPVLTNNSGTNHSGTNHSGASGQAIAPTPSGLASLPSAPIPKSGANGANAAGATPFNFVFPQSIAQGTTIRVGGSTSMVQISQGLKQAIEQRYAGVTVQSNAEGSGAGLAAIAQGTLDVAGISRTLTPQETQSGLVAVPVAKDAIAMVVGKENPFTGSISPDQAAQIFQGQLTNWSQLGGANQPIRVINRPPISGTHQAFKALVLKGQPFGTTSNITTMSRDATTPMLRALGNDGIGYATSAQVAEQQTVRMIPINGKTIYAADYPLQRALSYAYRQPPNPAVQAFLGFALSPEGQKAVQGQ